MPKTLDDLPQDLTGKKLLVRLDLNVGIDETTGEIRNDRRIRASLPTLENLLGRGAAVIAMSHLGRPKPGGDPAKNAPFTMNHVARRLGGYLNRSVQKTDEVMGDSVRSMASSLKPGEILVLENVRFHPFEQPLKKDGATDDEKAAHKQGMAQLAADLAALGDGYVNDAFGSLQNKDVSVLGLPKAMVGKPRVMGLLVAKELRIINDLMDRAQRPVFALMGGAKVSDKIKFIQVLLERVDKLLIGGKMTYTFLKADQVPVGAMKIDPKDEELVKGLTEEQRSKIVVPRDYVVVASANMNDVRVSDNLVPPDYEGVDTGPKTIEDYQRMLASAQTIIWNGPVGWFEKPPFDKGTRAIAQTLAELAQKGATVVVGGGETAEAVEEFGLADQLTHVSTGGGAFLKYVEERRFDTLDALEQ